MNPAEIILAAILRARAEGDGAAAEALEALLDDPDEAAKLVGRLGQIPSGAGARTSD